MAEKGILVNDQVGGESIACRDAIQTDDDSNARVVQLTDKAVRPVEFQLTTPLRDEISVSDSFDLDPVPTDIVTGLLDVSDAESCVLWGLVGYGSTSSDCLFVVTPVILSNDATPLAIALLPPIQMRPVFPKKAANSTTAASDSIRLTNYSRITIATAFPTHGAKRLGFHITKDGGNTNSVLSIFAEPTSGVGRNSALDQEVADDVWGSSFVYAAI